MNNTRFNLLLADDDPDDCMFFQEALEELALPANLAIVIDGVELIEHLNTAVSGLPDIIFMDLNMPRKTGFECLSEIRSDKMLKHLPIIILSTSLDSQVATTLHEKGANYYIRKPGEFSDLKKAIQQVINIVLQKNVATPDKEKFVIQV